MCAGLTAIALFALFAATATAEESTSTVSKEPSDEKAISLIGGPFGKVFAEFGIPSNLLPAENAAGVKQVCIVYNDAYGFNVRDKKVVSCIFWSDWPGTVRGVRIGESPEEVEKKLGRPQKSETYASGLATMYWEDKVDDRLLLMIEFDKDHKVDWIVQNLK